MADLIRRKKLNAVMTAPNILHSRSVLFKGFISFPWSAGWASSGRDSESCFLFHTLRYSQLSLALARLGSLGLNNACDKNTENVPLRNEKNVARSFSNHFPEAQARRDRETSKSNNWAIAG